MRLLDRTARKLKRRGVWSVYGALWATILGLLLLGGTLLVIGFGQMVFPAGAQELAATARPSPRPTPSAHIEIIRARPLPGLAQRATYYVEGGPKPRVLQGRLTMLACATPACTRYTLTIVGRCRVFSVGATVISDQPCRYLPVVRTTRLVRR